MTPTTTSVQERRQKSNCTEATRAKAARLEVLNITRREATVAGTHGDYVVLFDGLTCDCRAGQDGLHCSHVLAAIMERARMHGYGEVAFFEDAATAKASAVAQLKAGAKATLHEDAGYIYVEVQPRITGRLVIDDARPGRYIVHDEAGSVFGRYQDYLKADDCRKALTEPRPMADVQAAADALY